MTPYKFKSGPWSSHGQILRLADAWPRTFRILEVGTAEGYLGLALRARGFAQVVGIERDAQLAAEAQPHYARHVAADAERDGTLEALGTFDAVILADVLEHLREPQVHLQRVGRVVRSGGHVVVSLPNAVHWTMRLMVLFGRFDYAPCGLMDAGHVRFFTRRTATQLLEASGFRVRRVLVTPLPFERAAGGRLPGWVVRPLEWGYYAVSRCWSTLLAYQFIFLAQRQDS